MSPPSTSVEFQIIAIGSLACALITCIGLLALIDHFQQHRTPYKEVKSFAVLAHISLLILNLHGGVTMNSALFPDLHENYTLISGSNCKYMLIAIFAFNFLAKYFMNAFSLSRLRYFFHSSSLALDVRIYYGWLVSYAIFAFSLLIYEFIIVEPQILTAVDNTKIQKCHPDPSAMKIYLFYLAVADGFMQCVLLYLYYKKYRQFRLSVNFAENIDDKYVKKHVVKRSLFLGMISIIATWICGGMVMVRSPLFSVMGIVISLIIQIMAIIFSFDVCCVSHFCYGQNNGEQIEDVELVDMDEIGRRRENEEYLEKIMAIYHARPSR